MRFNTSSCAIVGAAAFNARHFSSMQFDYVIAADGGWKSLTDIGFEAEEAVGDFDSLGYVPKAAHVLRVPEEKDESDLELAARRAAELNFETLVFYGCLSGRFDQTIAAINVMSHSAVQGKRVFGVGDKFCLAIVTPCTPLEFSAFQVHANTNQAIDLGPDADANIQENARYKNYISVFAAGGDAYGVTETGLKYPLDSATLPSDTSLGLSNEFCGQHARISLKKGELLVTFPEFAWYKLDNVFSNA